MNREDKRKAARILKTKGLSAQSADFFIKMAEYVPSKVHFQEGEKVKLNVDSITSHPDWPRLTSKYHDFVTSSKDRVFTVEYDEKHKNNPVLICLAEDETTPKWLFWEGNLVRC